MNTIFVGVLDQSNLYLYVYLLLGENREKAEKEVWEKYKKEFGFSEEEKSRFSFRSSINPSLTEEPLFMMDLCYPLRQQ